MLNENEIRDLLRTTKRIAVVGLSDNPSRDSYGVAGFLQRHGYEIMPVNPQLHGPVLGAQSYATLHDVPPPIDIVDIFRRSEFVPEIVEDAIAVGARAIWMQLGVIHPEAVRRASEAGLQVVIDRCIAIEYRRLMRDG
ncbi:MAG: CoA-binding protein [Oscillochloris sp.]|nr:CoA-binding protein [Oscillochloris sp.]